MLNRVISKIKENGFFWFLRRLMREFRNPSTPFTRKYIDKFLYVGKGVLKILGNTREDDFLYAIYDLDLCPITFDIIMFLIDAEYEARRKNKSGFVVVFVPSNDPDLFMSKSFEWKEYSTVIDVASRQWRFQNIVVPLIFLSGKCKGYYLLPQRSDVVAFIKGREVYPDLYDSFNLRGRPNDKAFYSKFDRPQMYEGLRAPKQGLKYVQDWASENMIKDPIVTISVRDYDFIKTRNSNIEAWLQFANYLRSNGYQPVVIPDTDAAFGDDRRFDGLIVFKECAWNIGLRMSLHEFAFLNFFVDHGCSLLAIFNPKCKYIRMNNQCHWDEKWVEMDGHDWTAAGMNFGDNFKFATSGQWLSYKTDSFENLVYEFERFVEERL